MWERFRIKYTLALGGNTMSTTDVQFEHLLSLAKENEALYQKEIDSIIHVDFSLINRII